MTTETSPAPGSHYHYILTESRPITNGYETATVVGVLTIGPAATRSAALEYVREDLRAAKGWAQGGTVLFFSLEPNDLGA